MADDKEAIIRAEVLDLHSSNGTVDKLLAPPGKRFRHEPVTVTGISVVSSLWLLFILAVSGALIVSFIFPTWVTVDSVRINRDLIVENVYIGLFRYCRDNTNGTQQCERYGVDNTDPLAPDSLNEVQAFFAACIVYASGCVLLIVSFLLGLTAYFKPRIFGVSVFLITFFVQLIAVVLLVAGLLIFPIGFDSAFAKQFCSEQHAGVYDKGSCDLGWAYFVAMIATAVAMYLPSLAIFSMNISDGVTAHVCC